jgi:hypothetical protein
VANSIEHVWRIPLPRIIQSGHRSASGIDEDAGRYAKEMSIELRVCISVFRVWVWRVVRVCADEQGMSRSRLRGPDAGACGDAGKRIRELPLRKHIDFV